MANDNAVVVAEVDGRQMGMRSLAADCFAAIEDAMCTFRLHHLPLVRFSIHWRHGTQQFSYVRGRLQRGAFAAEERGASFARREN